LEYGYKKLLDGVLTRVKKGRTFAVPKAIRGSTLRSRSMVDKSG